MFTVIKKIACLGILFLFSIPSHAFIDSVTPDKRYLPESYSIVNGKRVRLDANLFYVGGLRTGEEYRATDILVTFNFSRDAEEEYVGRRSFILDFLILPSNQPDVNLYNMIEQHAATINVIDRLDEVNWDTPEDGDGAAGVCVSTLYKEKWRQQNGYFTVRVEQIALPLRPLAPRPLLMGYVKTLKNGQNALADIVVFRKINGQRKNVRVAHRNGQDFIDVDVSYVGYSRNSDKKTTLHIKSGYNEEGDKESLLIQTDQRKRLLSFTGYCWI